MFRAFPEGTLDGMPLEDGSLTCEHVKALLGRTAKLTFQLVDQSVSVEDARRGRLPPGTEILPGEEEPPIGELRRAVRAVQAGVNSAAP